MPDLRCKVCGNPQISESLTGNKPNKAVCDWTCASILNWKLIITGSIVCFLSIPGIIFISYWYLLLFGPLSAFFWYSLYLIITQRKKKKEDRLEFIGEESDK